MNVCLPRRSMACTCHSTMLNNAMPFLFMQPFSHYSISTRKCRKQLSGAPLAKAEGLNTNVLSFQTQCATKYLVRIIRWDDIVSHDVIAAINALQLLSGFDTPVMENTSIPLKYVSLGWLPNLRDMLEQLVRECGLRKHGNPKS